MKHKGITYDVGTLFPGNRSTRPVFDPAVMRREIEIIRQDLHCNAIRLCGDDLTHLRQTAEHAIAQELAVWFSPMKIDATPEKTLTYLARCAPIAEELARGRGKIIFILGGEMSFFMQGILQGRDLYSRMRSFMRPLGLLRNMLTGGRWPGRRLNQFLSTAVSAVRQQFKGRITYASGPWERINWDLFDIVSVNYYRTGQSLQNYRAGLQRYFKHGKPVAITEFGCCSYTGADQKGGAGWAIVDTTQPRRRIKAGSYVRDEDVQARYLAELLEIFKQEPVDAAFVFNFAGYNLPHDQDPQFDLDMASYGVVKVLGDGMRVATYSGMPWEPKQGFAAVKSAYGLQPAKSPF